MDWTGRGDVAVGAPPKTNATSMEGRCHIGDHFPLPVEVTLGAPLPCMTVVT